MDNFVDKMWGFRRGKAVYGGEQITGGVGMRWSFTYNIRGCAQKGKRKSGPRGLIINELQFENPKKRITYMTLSGQQSEHYRRGDSIHYSMEETGSQHVTSKKKSMDMVQWTW